MKKFIITLIFIYFSIDSFSQSTGEPPEIYNWYKKQTDSLSFITKKKVTGFGRNASAYEEKFIIYYDEDNKIKDSVLHTRRVNFKYSSSQWTVNSNYNVFH
jgi:hypothetical protein